MILRLCLIVTILISVAHCPAAARSSDQPIRVLVLSGKNNHDWHQTTPMIVRVLEESRTFSVRVLEDPSLCTDRSLKDVDVILSNWTNFPSRDRVWGDEAERAITGFVRSGKGFVVVHAASACFPAWPDYQELIGATWGENTGHGAYGAFSIAVTDTSHPITRVLSGFTAEDELWHRMSRSPGAHVLCTGFSDTARGGTGAAEPVAYCMPFGQGRSFNLVLGHDARAMTDPSWRLLLLRGTQWAATGEATIEEPYDVQAALRAAVIAGEPRREQLRDFDRLIQCSSRNPGLRRELAHALSAMLDSSTTLAWKKSICAWLSLVGNTEEVPALARLVDDPHLGFAARGALERIAYGAHADTIVHTTGKVAGDDAVLATVLSDRSESADAARLTPRRRAQVFYALADAGERGALKDMYAALGSDQPVLRRSALYGIAKLGDVSSVPRLCDAMKNAAPEERDEISRCLSRIPDQAVDERLCSLLGSHYPPAIKEQIIAALAARGARTAVPTLMKAATSGSATLRESAVNALGSLADGSIAPDLITVLKNERNATNRSAFVKCLVNLALRDPTPGRVCDAILASLPGSSTDARASMFQILGRFGGEKALHAVRPALADADQAVQRSAIRVLSAWPDSAPLEDLFTLAHSPGENAVRTLAMQGGVGLLEKCHDLQEDAKVKILERELGRAGSREIETMLISSLGKLSSAGALRLAESRLTRPEVATEAALAVAAIAGTMDEKHAEVAQHALANALQSVRSSPIEAQMHAALEGRLLQTGQRKIRVALVTGGHPFDEQPFLALFTADTGIICTHVPLKDDSEIFEETATWPYDVIVLYNMTRRITERRQQNLLRLFDAGVGLVSLHHASAAFPDWCEYPKIIGCRYLLAPTEFDGMRLEPSTYRHDTDIPVHVADTGHAVTAGIQNFVVRDETYHGCQFEPDNHLLLTTDEKSSDAPLAWSRLYRQARVVHCQLGHGPEIFTNGQFRTLVAQAIRWCAEGRREQIERDAALRRGQR